MEDKRFRIILSSKKTYRDVELTETAQKAGTEQILIGTSVYAHVRLREQDFQAPFAFLVKKSGEDWEIVCQESVYFQDCDAKKKISKRLCPGDEITIRYFDTDDRVLTLYFSIDFDYELKKYDRVIDIESVRNMKIGYEDDCQIRLPNSGNHFGTVKIWKNGSQYMLQRDSAGYGIRLNGMAFRDSAELSTFDFFSVGEYSFCFCEGKLYTDSSNDLTFSGVTVFDEQDSASHHVYPKYNRSTRIRKNLPTENWSGII